MTKSEISVLNKFNVINIFDFDIFSYIFIYAVHLIFTKNCTLKMFDSIKFVSRMSKVVLSKKIVFGNTSTQFPKAREEGSGLKTEVKKY